MKKTNEQIKLCITGGHITPAIALVEEVQRIHPDWEIVCIGRRFALEGEGIESQEMKLLGNYHIRFLPLTAGRLTRVLTLTTLWSLAKFPIGYFQAFRYLMREKPTLIVSFGGYIALPVVVAGVLLGIPCVAHEQTHVPGLANRIIARFAKRICVSFPEVASQFARAKTVVTGLPIRKGLFQPPQIISPSFDSSHELIYITGGSTGAVSLNALLFPLIRRLTQTYMVVHQTGNSSFVTALHVREDLSQKQKDRYVVSQTFDIQQLSWIFSHATLVIGRSGANTVGELAALGKVAVLVPLPWSAGGEQKKNALWLVRHGGAVILDQERLTPHALQQAIEATLKNIMQYQQKAKRLKEQFPRDGAHRLLREIERVNRTLWQSKGES